MTVTGAAATAPVFTDPIGTITPENERAIGFDGIFSATGTGMVTLTLGGTDAGLFSITDGGTLSFNTAPDFEMPRGM